MTSPRWQHGNNGTKGRSQSASDCSLGRHTAERCGAQWPRGGAQDPEPPTTQEDLCYCRRRTTTTGRGEPRCLPTSYGCIPTSYGHGYSTGNGSKKPLIIAWHMRCAPAPGASAHLRNGFWGRCGGGGSRDYGDAKLPYRLWHLLRNPGTLQYSPCHVSMHSRCTRGVDKRSRYGISDSASHRH
jgi:hypothetical protein